jgi:hypothetical protein
MRVECSTVESFKTIIRAASSDALPESDFTAKVLFDGLPSGQDIFYRVRFEDLALSGISGETRVGHFRTAPADKGSISVVWSGDTAGQGWGIDASRGGMRTYGTTPGFFHSFRRSYLRRLSDPFRTKTAERRDLAQHRDGREISCCAQPRAISRQL